MIRENTMKTKQKRATPKATELRIRIIPQCPEPIDNGKWPFYCSFPKWGSPDVLIVAETAKRAKDVLEEFLRNELDGHENLEN